MSDDARRRRARREGYNASVREESARRVLLVQAIEEADRDGRVLAPAERIAATTAARERVADPARLVEERAARLVQTAAAQTGWVSNRKVSV